MYISGPDGGGDAVRGAILATGIAAAAVGGKDRFGESAFHGTSSVGRRMPDSVHRFSMQCIIFFFSIYTIIYRDLFLRVQGNEGGLGYPSREVVCTLLGAQRKIADGLQGDQYTRACLEEAQARLHLACVVHGCLAREKLFNSTRTDTNGEGRNGKRRRVSTPMNMCNTAYMAATRMTNTHLPREGKRRAPSQGRLPERAALLKTCGRATGKIEEPCIGHLIRWGQKNELNGAKVGTRMRI